MKNKDLIKYKIKINIYKVKSKNQNKIKIQIINKELDHKNQSKKEKIQELNKMKILMIKLQVRV